MGMTLGFDGGRTAQAGDDTALEGTGRAIVDNLRAHPRLWIPDGDFDIVRQTAQHSELTQGWYRQLRDEADTILASPPVTYEIPDGLRLLSVSRKLRNRVLRLGLLHGIDGGDDLVERAWQELEAAAAFPDWNPRHFLDVAEMAHGFAMGYDWLHHALTEERRAAIRRAIVHYALEPALLEYRNPVHWSIVSGNWNLVCNGGIGLAALAIGEEEPEIAEEVLQFALASLPLALAQYAPDGANPEGVGTYWDDATRFLLAFGVGLETATGSSNGITETEGLDVTGHFPIHLTGPTGMSFNYYDGPPRSPHPPEMHWLANRFSQPTYEWWAQGMDNGFERRLLWHNPDIVGTDPATAGWSRDRVFRHAEVFVSRSAWSDPRAMFVGFKAGTNDVSHSDLDLGAFALDALGIRWATELGKDDYNLPGYFDREPEGVRWTYYRKRTEGQNTLVVDPGEGPEQSLDASAKIVSHDSGPTKAFAVADLTSAYPHRGVSSWLRGCYLSDHRRQVVIRDELHAEQEVDTWWFMHTEAEISIGEDGKEAVLASGEARLVVRILTPDDGAGFEVLAAAPLPTSPNPEGQDPNEGIRKLAIQLTGVTAIDLTVAMNPLRRWEDAEAVDWPDVEPLAEWAIPAPHQDVPVLASLTLDGEPVPGFAPEVFTYDIVDTVVSGSDVLPVVAATSDDPNVRIRISQPEGNPGTAVIDVLRRATRETPGRPVRSPNVRYLVHLDRTVITPYADQWSFRDGKVEQVLSGEIAGTPAVLGDSAAPEEGEPTWHDAPAALPDGTTPTVLAIQPTGSGISLADTADLLLAAGADCTVELYQSARSTLPRIVCKGEQLDVWINNNGSVLARILSKEGVRYDTSTYPDAVPLGSWVSMRVALTLTEDGQGTFRIFRDDEELPIARTRLAPMSVLLEDNGEPFRIGSNYRGVRGLDGYVAAGALTVPGAADL